METLYIFIIAGIILICCFIDKILKRILFQPKPLPWYVKAKADRKFNKLLNIFKRKYKRAPTKDELFRIIINASHITIRKRGKHGHWGRQKIRKYLLEKHRVVKEYIMK